MNNCATAFERRVADTARAIAARPPLMEEERVAGWEEDPLGSGLRRNVLTGEWDDSLLIGAPGWYREYRVRASSGDGGKGW